ncbi:hypothetical protein SCHIN_v1c11980 [Spiroplasma chinense]|uniref:DUF951 domain-containing protein n=1 Tax=Spiroplasma chinense TaxID=216932 RepID=A0A5B9Y5S5_9MOLU|nr:DUF951 domain-containing protein [Spiroplasma chinense]QEH62391.1 hypothetical protein SCHIN_v1c11980 [Spiroplasma chinense]
MKINLNDIVILKKPHPSKTEKWKVIRVGVIYKLQSTIDSKTILEFKKENLIKAIKAIESEK